MIHSKRGVEEGGGAWGIREGLTVEWDGAAETRLLTSCERPCWSSHREALPGQFGTPPSSQLFLPPWRSVSITESNFGTRSGSVGMFLIPRPGLSFLEFPSRREWQGGEWWQFSSSLGGCRAGLHWGWHSGPRVTSPPSSAVLTVLPRLRV